MREVSIARFVPAPTDTTSTNAFDTFYTYLADNPLILLIFAAYVVIQLMRWHDRTAFRRYHGPKLKREIDLYRNAGKRTVHRINPPMAPTVDREAYRRPEYNVDGRRIN